MKYILDKYTSIREEIFHLFDLKPTLILKDMSKYKWSLIDIEGEDIKLLALWDEDEIEFSLKNKFVVVKNKDRPIIRKKNGYTLIVCIDCIKIALILNDENKI